MWLVRECKRVVVLHCSSSGMGVWGSVDGERFGGGATHSLAHVEIERSAVENRVDGCGLFGGARLAWLGAAPK